MDSPLLPINIVQVPREDYFLHLPFARTGWPSSTECSLALLSSLYGRCSLVNKKQHCHVMMAMMGLKDGFIRDDFRISPLCSIFHQCSASWVNFALCLSESINHAHHLPIPIGHEHDLSTVIDQGGSWLQQCGHWWSLVLPPLSLSTGRIKI